MTEAAVSRSQKELSRDGNLEESRAEQVISHIPNLTEAAARTGKNKAVIMDITAKDYERPSQCLFRAWDWRVCKPEWLAGACKLVFDYCQEAGLDPRIEYWHEDVGMKTDGFYMVVHW
ncbi:MAG: hypothetical protein A2745_02080 [Candidatus Harrisonbacteria bacterium RIFCSPHIGHO2_01_FULL_44_13]|uniref:Uncharacterized protein n=1 Tax=Candidatus Harrisonbacteria bacterium RIFCSPLOWO2_01_FULL_44_18 TaxID=1798407 RepID=A0A1G1ZMW9_9BACT|nr:MAG: hypothetical protein A2745_02080 [Candidatus Harrisonbacteria bacterium RIFCSPHIGHO2_01_FULL_44_13]OGY66008.1 MAG: hypothetical protein A3A16_01325 [Candidatus Harrisonbacteria bacterium RIFCSPLOWO2_01_FULL_44_18]